MKKKIVIGLTFFSLALFLVGVYIIATIEKATSTLDTLIKLHQVEILRENLLIRIKRVQNDLNLKHTRYARGVYTVVADVRNMESVSNECFKCHHAPYVVERLTDMRNHIERYKDAISRVLTIKANIGRLEAEEDNAIMIGEELVAKVDDMIKFTGIKLEEKTTASLRDISRIKIVLFSLVAIGPFVVAFLGFVFIRGLTRPLNVLLNATRSLKSGNLDYRIEGLRDEFGEVAASFNEMATSLNEQMHKMQRAEQMSVVGEMAASIAHEIKNPLTGLKIALQMLLENKNLAESEMEIANASFSQIKRMESLVREVLDFARPKEPEHRTTNLNALIEQTIAFIEAVSSQSGQPAIRVVKSLSSDVPEVMVDPTQIQQAVMNIVLNAYDAMPDGGVLGVKTAVNDDTVVATVSDTGGGIGQKDIDKLFKPFFTTKTKGTGLGLPITKGIIERHGGSINIRSETGKGTTVIITLPLTRKGDEGAGDAADRNEEFTLGKR